LLAQKKARMEHRAEKRAIVAATKNKDQYIQRATTAYGKLSIDRDGSSPDVIPFNNNMVGLQVAVV
jgi:hypothetical protein